MAGPHQSRLMLCMCFFGFGLFTHVMGNSSTGIGTSSAAATTVAAAVAAVSNLCAIETYEMQKCSPEKQQQQQQQIKHEAQQ